MNEEMERTIVDSLVNKVSPILILLFGSSVKGTSRTESDVDIAFLSEKFEIDPYETFLIAQELASTLNKDIDLVDLRKASTVFQAEIVHTGKTIYCKDKHKQKLYEMKVLKMYAKLNEERMPILEKISESGSIYGN